MKKQLDKILLSSIWVQLFTLLCVVFIFSVLVFFLHKNVSFESEVFGKISQLENSIVGNNLPQNAATKEDVQVKTRVWYIIGRLLDPGYLGDSNDKLYTLLISIFGWVFCGGFLIAIFTNAYFERIKKLENGQVRYQFSNHCIIFGCNEMTPNLIAQIFNKEGFDTGNSIIVHSNRNSKELRTQLKTHLDDKMEKHLFVFRGDRNSEEELAGLHLEKAGLIIIVNETDEPGSDAKNIDCFETAAAIISDRQKKKGITQIVPFYVHFNEQPSFQMAKDYDVDRRFFNYVKFFPFNFCEQWARKVFVNYAPFFKDIPTYSPLDYEAITKESNKHVHLFILGYNSMGESLAVQAGRLCHFPNKSKTIITFIDKLASEHELGFKAQYPGIASLTDVEFTFESLDVYSEEARQMMLTSSNDKDTLSYIAVCFQYPDYALSVGLNLPKAIFSNRVPVIIRQQREHAMHDQLFPTIKFFGMLKNNFIFDSITDKMAAKANRTYEETINPEGLGAQNEIEAWDNLRSIFKWANRYLVDSYPMKLRSLGLDVDTIGKGQSNEFVSSETEHRRWMAERVLSGWQYGKFRNDKLKIHPLIVHSNELNAEEVDKDIKLHEQVIKTVLNLREDFNCFPRSKVDEKVYEKTACVKAKILVSDSIVSSLENKQLVAKKGEVLCKGIENELWVMTHDRFIKKYISVPGATADKEGFEIFKPIPNKNRVFAKCLTVNTNIKISVKNELCGRIGDQMLRPCEGDDEEFDSWIVDANIFEKSYVLME